LRNHRKIWDSCREITANFEIITTKLGDSAYRGTAKFGDFYCDKHVSRPQYALGYVPIGYSLRQMLFYSLPYHQSQSVSVKQRQLTIITVISI
jgi:hypothetical protein